MSMAKFSLTHLHRFPKRNEFCDIPVVIAFVVRLAHLVAMTSPSTLVMVPLMQAQATQQQAVAMTTVASRSVTKPIVAGGLALLWHCGLPFYLLIGDFQKSFLFCACPMGVM